MSLFWRLLGLPGWIRCWPVRERGMDVYGLSVPLSCLHVFDLPLCLLPSSQSQNTDAIQQPLAQKPASLRSGDQPGRCFTSTVSWMVLFNVQRWSTPTSLSPLPHVIRGLRGRLCKHLGQIGGGPRVTALTLNFLPASISFWPFLSLRCRLPPRRYCGLDQSYRTLGVFVYPLGLRPLWSRLSPDVPGKRSGALRCSASQCVAARPRLDDWCREDGESVEYAVQSAGDFDS